MNLVTRVQVSLKINQQKSADAPTSQHQAKVEQRVAKTLAALARDNGEKLIARGVQATTPIIKRCTTAAEVGFQARQAGRGRTGVPRFGRDSSDDRRRCRRRTRRRG